MRGVSEFNVVLAGVGGQGILLAAEILGASAVRDGLNVRVSEIHGMAQRGGAVISNVRIGSRVLAATVMEGQADVLLGFEPVETLRSLSFASEKTLVIMNSQGIMPTELTAKMQSYPTLEEVEKKIRRFTEKMVVVDVVKLAERAGNVLAQNIVLLGVLAAAAHVPVEKESLMEALGELVPAKHLDVNVKAFELGYKYGKEAKF